MTDDRIDYHRNRLRGVPLADLGRMLGEVLRDVAREAAEVERARAQPQPKQADAEDDSRWLGPFTTATEALNELRIAVATMMGADPNTWPDHGNAPLAIAAAFGIRQHAMELQSYAQADALAVPQPPSAQADAVEALEMIAHKIGRILNGDPGYADSWVDIAGYAQLVADRLNGVER